VPSEPDQSAYSCKGILDRNRYWGLWSCESTRITENTRTGGHMLAENNVFVARLRAQNRTARDGGASLVEFAVVLPFLLLLMLGIIEFGILFGHFNEVRHGAREGARYAAVSRPDHNGDTTIGDNTDVIAATCDSVNLPGSVLQISLSYDDSDSSGTPDRLEHGTLTVLANTSSLSGAPIISSFIPSTLTNSGTFRLERDGGWTGFTDQTCP